MRRGAVTLATSLLRCDVNNLPESLVSTCILLGIGKCHSHIQTRILNAPWRNRLWMLRRCSISNGQASGWNIPWTHKVFTSFFFFHIFNCTLSWNCQIRIIPRTYCGTLELSDTPRWARRHKTSAIQSIWVIPIDSTLQHCGLTRV